MDERFAGVWLGLGVTLTLMGIVPMVTGGVDPESLPGILALVFGAGYFASGLPALKLRSMERSRSRPG